MSVFVAGSAHPTVVLDSRLDEPNSAPARAANWTGILCSPYCRHQAPAPRAAHLRDHASWSRRAASRFASVACCPTTAATAFGQCRDSPVIELLHQQIVGAHHRTLRMRDDLALDHIALTTRSAARPDLAPNGIRGRPPSPPPLPACGSTPRMAPGNTSLPACVTYSSGRPNVPTVWCVPSV